MSIIIQHMNDKDWRDVGRIYLDGMNTFNATFQTEIPTWNDWNDNHCNICRLVMIFNKKVIGWAALSKVSKKEVYSGVAEVSIYLDSMYRGRGLGVKLLNTLITLSEENSYWTLQAGIFPENISSLKIHKKCGFKELGIRKKVGKMHTGKWRDVVFLERRSQLVGID